MLDLKEEVKGFNPIDLTTLSSDETLYTESMRIAFTLYNKALREIDDGYRDLAKNSLRKAVNLYPEFGEAVMVLGICTFVNGDRIGAVRIFNSIKKPEDRKRGMEILDRLASAPEYISTSARSEPPTVSVAPIREPERTSPSGSIQRASARDLYIPGEFRPSSQARPSESTDAEKGQRGIRTQQIGSRRQELMRSEAAGQNGTPGMRTQAVRPAVSTRTVASAQRVKPEPDTSAQSSGQGTASPSRSVLSQSRLLTLIFIILAVFAILAAAAWMSASAENKKLQRELSSAQSEAPSAASQSPIAVSPNP